MMATGAKPKRLVTQHRIDETEIGSIMTLPRSLHEAYQLHLKRIDHPAVKLFSSSLQAHRSCNEAILFLYGVSGAGKSSTLNHLFSTDLIPTSATKSATDCVTEWVSSMHSEHWCVSNLEVGFVDVPGWGDSEGRDATNFALMQQFLSVHPILGCKLRKFYPNIVLLVFSSNDNRMLGSEANALRMITSLSKLNIVDKTRPNVVIVLTHVCSHPREGFAEKMGEQSVIYQNIARACLGVYPPVVWMENNPKYELERRGDWTLLYDGTEQPLNLYEAIRNLMDTTGDEIGKEAVRLYFGSSKVIHLPKERLIIDPKFCDKRTLSAIERNWLNTLHSRTPSYRSTSLNKYLLNYISSHQEIGITQVDVTALLVALACEYPNRSSILTRDLSVLESTLQPYMLNVKEKELLTRALELDTPNFPVCISCIGKGYNVVNDSITSGHIFDISMTEKFCSFLNRPIPMAFSVLPIESNKLSMTLNQRASSIGKVVTKEMQVVRAPSFGSSIDEDSKCITEVEILKFVYEIGLFNAELNMPYVELSEQFCHDIDSLPDDGENSDIFNDLFKKYGHFVIFSGNAGGLIEGSRVPVDRDTCISKSEFVNMKSPYLQMFFDLIKDGVNWREIEGYLSVEEISNLSKLESIQLEWYGGHKSFTSNTIKEISVVKYLNWLQSLKQFPVLFDFSFNFIPIHLLVATRYPVKAELLKRALEHILPEKYNTIYINERDFDIDSLGSLKTQNTKVHPQQPNIPLPESVRKFRNLSGKGLNNLQSLIVLSHRNAKRVRINVQPTSREEVSHYDTPNIAKMHPNCFSSDSMVFLKNGKSVRMCEVRIGDSVLSLNRKTNQPVFSKVYMWGHIDHDRTASFLRIRHEHGTVRLTDNHLILHGCDKRVIKASNIQIGDLLYYFECSRDENESTSGYTLIPTFVTSVTRCVYEGVYSPFTHNSTVVVDGVVCSVFAVPDDSVTQFCKFEKISKIALSPFIFTSAYFCGDNVITKLQRSNKLHPYPELLLRIYNSVPTLRSYF